MHHGNADREVESTFLVRESQAIGHDSFMRLVLGGNLDEVRRPVAANDEDVIVHGEVFAISAANVQPNGARRERREKGRDNRPRLVAGGGKVRGNLFVDRMDVFLFVVLGFGDGIFRCLGVHFELLLFLLFPSL